MSSRRFTRLTNGFSKKLENHVAAVSLYVAHYNFCRVHEALTPDMRHQTKPRQRWRWVSPIMCGRLASFWMPRLQLRRPRQLRRRLIAGGGFE